MVLARCFQLQDAIAVLELDRVLDASPEELDRHRLGLRTARRNRLELITRSTEHLVDRIEGAAERANTKVLLKRAIHVSARGVGASTYRAWVIDSPVEGLHYPGSLPELRRWFTTDADCLDYLDWLRWPDGLVCPECGTGPVTPDSRRCRSCRRRTSPTAGTILHRTRTPLTVWFEAAWLLMVSKQGLSALELQRVTGLGSYQTAWAMLHKFRTAMSGTGRAKLTGRVEVDESIYGGVDPDSKGRSLGSKVLVAGAVEQRGPHGLGRARLQVIRNASQSQLGDFLTDHVATGSTIITDGWGAYPDLAARLRLGHIAHNQSTATEPAHVLLPGVHRLFSLSKRVLDTTHQGGVQNEHLQAYLDEFVFRFNRRNAKARGLLFLRLLEHAVTAPPTPYRDLIAVHRTTPAPARPITSTRRHPRTLAGETLNRPWPAA